MSAAASPTLRVLCGHRALLHGPLKSSAPARPPLVLIGGTAQWLDSWQPHLSAFARERQVLIYETRGQAGAMRAQLPSLDLSDCSLPRHGEDFWRVVAEATAAGLETRGEIDVLGFSFGARVAMAAATAAATTAGPGAPAIRKLCVTGVASDRGTSGRLALKSWRASLSAGDLRGFAWRLILDTHSPAYLAAHEKRVGGWVEAVVKANTAEGVGAIVEQTHTEDESDPSHPLSMCRALRAGGGAREGLLMIGDCDVLSPVASSRRLAEEAGWRFELLEGAAHAAPIEQAARWRRAALEFLDGRRREVIA